MRPKPAQCRSQYREETGALGGTRAAVAGERDQGLSRVSAGPAVLLDAGYPGFDLEDPDWPAFREQLAQVDTVLNKIKQRVPPTST